MSFIPYGRQHITQADIDEVTNVLQSDFITQGPKVPEFEQAVCDFVETDYAVAVNSATSALHIACLALDFSVNDILWTSPISFVASANCALYCGGKVDFVDINTDTFNICVVELERKLKVAKLQGLLPKILVVVHLGGSSCDMQQIKKLSDEYGFAIIEDASHAIGGKYLGSYIGNCKYSDICVFSFHPVKIITTVEGGMATTNNPQLADKMRLLRSHGVTRDPQLMNKNSGPWYYEQLELGFNYRLTDIQAALGISQLNRLGEYIEKRNLLASNYRELLKHLPVSYQKVEACNLSSYHLFIIRVNSKVGANSRASVFDALRKANIGVNVHYIPIHTQPYYKEFKYLEQSFKNAEEYYDEAISLPLFPDLTHEQQAYIVDHLKSALLKAV